MIKPSLSEFKKLSNQGNLIPVFKEVPYKIETPTSLFRKINKDRYSFLFESAEGGQKWGRFSFLGSTPLLLFRSKGEKYEIIKDGIIIKRGIEKDPLKILENILNQYRILFYDSLPRFFGGAIGYISYEYVRSIERLPYSKLPNNDFFDCYFMIADKLIVFDNFQHKLIIIVNAFLDGRRDLEDIYKEACQNIMSFEKELKIDSPPPLHHRCINSPHIEPSLNKDDFIKMVKIAKSYIRNGDIIQVVLSQRFTCEIFSHPFDIYCLLRSINPSPYLFYLNFDDTFLLGASPEVMVRLEGKKIELRPLAGTRPRGKTFEEDLSMEKDLLSDEKERAEHIMLVDLGRNDIGKVSEIGSVKVKEFMAIERYSHVMHIMSYIEGILSPDKNAFDLLRATFPAGTVSGAPKIRAMEIIEELEPVNRGPYAGSVGYFSFSGDMDMCITIRSIFIKNNRAIIQAGAGIVADSDPEKEYDETLNKAKALFKAIMIANGGIE